jgi:Arc/MetJ family transcription regulator
MHKENLMRTTLDLPENLIKEAMELTNISVKTDVIKLALSDLIRKEKIKGIKDYFGKIDLDINLDIMRKR